MAGHNKKGRSKGGGHFVQLHDWMMNSAAWQALSPAERAIYIEVARLYATVLGWVGGGDAGGAAIA